MTDIAKDMPWLGRAWSTVQQRLAQDRLPHALLVVGEQGVGKRAWAEAVAGLLLCDQQVGLDDGAPIACGQCRQCQLIAANSHPDVRVYSPEKSRMVKVEDRKSVV